MVHQNQFQLKEEIGRVAFQNFARTNNEFWEIQEMPLECRYDISMFHGNFKIVHGEIKVRPVFSNHVYTGKPDGFILEQSKYCDLTGLTHSKYYINIFKDKVVIWDVDQITPDWQIEIFTKKTCRPELGQVKKKVTYLHLSAATFQFNHKTDFTQIENDIKKAQERSGD